MAARRQAQASKQHGNQGLYHLRVALFVGFLLCMTVWWELFHEMARNWILAAPWREDIGPFTLFERLSMTFHCPGRALGIVIGAGLYLYLSKKGKQRAAAKIPLAGWGVLLVALDLLHFLALVPLHNFPLASLLHVVVNAILTYGFIGCSQALFDRPVRYSVIAAIAMTSGLVLMNLVVAPFLGTIGNELFDETLSLGFLLMAMICAFGLSRALPAWKISYSETRDEQGSKDVEGPLLAPVRITHTKESRLLVSHLVMYGAILGFLHTIGRRMVYGEAFTTASIASVSSDGSITVGVGALLAIVIIGYLALRHGFSFALVWETLRKMVFTLAVLEFMLVPLISTAFPGVVAGDTATALYLMLFVIGACLFYKESDCSGPGLMAWGLLLLGIGQFVSGMVLEYGVRQLLVDSQMFAILRVVGFLLCCIATFWVGSDADVKKLWGLRHSLLPKQYQDKLVREKVAILGKRAELTKREQEVLALLAQGVRADAIGGQLFISPNTVRTHIQNAYGKLDIHSVKELNALLADVAAAE